MRGRLRWRCRAPARDRAPQYPLSCLVEPEPPCGKRGHLARRLFKLERHGFIWPAKFVCVAAFISCTGPQGEDAGRRLAAVFARGNLDAVRSFRIDDSIDDTC